MSIHRELIYCFNKYLIFASNRYIQRKTIKRTHISRVTKKQQREFININFSRNLPVNLSKVNK